MRLDFELRLFGPGYKALDDFLFSNSNSLAFNGIVARDFLVRVSFVTTHSGWNRWIYFPN
jgi:hypothetical protein